MSPDGRFLAGPVPEVPGLWVASGCNGSGFSSSPAIGEALAQWITGGRPPVDLSSLSPARFGSLAGPVPRLLPGGSGPGRTAPGARSPTMSWSSGAPGSTPTTTTRWPPELRRQGTTMTGQCACRASQPGTEPAT